MQPAAHRPDVVRLNDLGDAAAAVPHMLGFHLPRNFNLPYLAVNVADQWRRWHISLSSWLRDYLFHPLGGSRGGKWRTCFNQLLTMTGHERVCAIVLIVTAGANFVMSEILLRLFGLNGAALAATLSYLVCNGTMALFVYHYVSVTPGLTACLARAFALGKGGN